jgi:hypothetical protein
MDPGDIQIIKPQPALSPQDHPAPGMIFKVFDNPGHMDNHLEWKVRTYFLPLERISFSHGCGFSFSKKEDKANHFTCSCPEATRVEE